ncbi:FUSC family protein [Legionella oakridgensis]|nr:FUSC family protein [Legionella oakridgensis]KTD43969.1 inner membrane protein [Legionella oakridgensis]STY19626.1 inner membrane protein [Legionella longbeachae]
MKYFKFILPKTVENRAALRTSLGALAAVLIAFKLHLDTPYWAGMTVVIVSNLYVGSIIDKALMRVAGTIAGALFGFYFAAFIANSFLLYLLTCFLLVFFSVYYFNLSRYAYAFLLFGLTAFIILSQLATNPGNAFYIAIWRSSEIILGVVVAALSAYLFFPNYIHEYFTQQIAVIFNRFEQELEQLKQLLYDNSLALTSISATNLALKKDLNKTDGMINFMRHEAGMTRTLLDKRRALIDLLRDLARHLNYFIYSHRNEPRHYAALCHQLPIEAVLNALHQDLNTLKTAFFSKQRSNSLLLTPQSIETLDAAFLNHRSALQNDIKYYYQIRHFFQQISTVLSYLHTLLIDQQTIRVSKIKIHDRIKRLQMDPDVIKHSIKAGLSVTLALLIWLMSQWPGGLNGIISSIVISIRKNIFEMKNVSLHRLLGCLLGGGTALTILAMTAMNLYDFIILLFFLIWGFSYFSFKYIKHAYIGLQANIALVITIAQGGGPPIYLDPPLERLGGIVIGIIASFIVANSVWRTDALTMLQGRLKKLTRLLLYNSQQILMPPTENKILHDPTTLFWVCRSLFELLSHERLSKKKQALLEPLKEQFTMLVFIQAIIMHIDTAINQMEAHSTGKILNIDLRDYESLVKQLYEETNRSNKEHILQQLENQLKEIENILLHNEQTDGRSLNLLAYTNALNQLARSSFIFP